MVTYGQVVCLFVCVSQRVSAVNHAFSCFQGDALHHEDCGFNKIISKQNEKTAYFNSNVYI